MSSYDYTIQRAQLFTDEGQRMFLKVRDRVQVLLRNAGAVRAQEALRDVGGDTWTMHACLDRLVELGEIRCVSDKVNTVGQHWVYVSARGEW